MAVTVDTVGLEGGSGIGNTSFVYGITVGSGSKQALIFFLGLLPAAATAPTGVAATWNSVPMTLLGSVSGGTTKPSIFIFGLRNPLQGAHSLAVSWTNSCSFVGVGISFNGVDQTNDAVAFPNFNSASNTTGSPSLSITTNSGDASVALTATQSTAGGTVSSPNQIQIINDNGTLAVNNGVGAQYALSSSTSTSFSWSLSNTINWVTAGVDIAQFFPPALSFYKPFNEPVRVPSRLQEPNQVANFWTWSIQSEQVTLDRWMEGLSIPSSLVKVGLGTQYQKAPFFVGFAPFPQYPYISSTWPRFSEPVRVPVGLRAEYQLPTVLGPGNDINLYASRSWPRFSEPVRIPLRLAEANQRATFLVEFTFVQVTYEQWYQWLSEPLHTLLGSGIINLYPSLFSLGKPLFNIDNIKLPLNIQNNGGISANQDWGGRVG